MRTGWGKGVALIAVLAAVSTAGAPVAAGAPQGATSVKRCKKGFVRKHGRCVCPKGKVKRGARCAKKPIKPAPVKPTTPSTPATPTNPAPATPTNPATPAPPTGGLTGQPAIDRFKVLISGSRMTRVTAAANLSSQSTTRFSYCADGASFVYYRESIGTYTSSTENATGTWSVTQAAFTADGNTAEGRVTYSAAPGDTSIGAGGEVIIRLTPSVSYIGSLDNEYQWAPGAAGC